MKDPYAKFDGISYRDIQWKLRSEQMPEDLVDKTLEAIRASRQERSDAKRRRRVSDLAWGEVIFALQHERKIVRSMVHYKTRTPAPERDELVAAYHAALAKLYSQLTLLRRRGGMPEHTHWTDFVPQHIKDAFIQESAAIPPRAKAKFKEPFQRTLPIDLRNRRHARLLRRTNAEMATAKLRLESDPDNARAARKVEVLDKALKRIRLMDSTAHVPDHWCDIVPELLVGNADLARDEPKPPRKPAPDRNKLGGIRQTFGIKNGKPVLINEGF
jgi:hypothetical protein